MSKKVRSVFWIVSTHVLTTGLAIPAVMGIASKLLIAHFDIRDPLIGLYLVATCSVVGCIGGTLYSLSYLGNEADCANWKRCTAPAIATFVILTILGLAAQIYSLQANTALTVGLLVATSLVSIAAFSIITSHGFSRMHHPEVVEDPVPAARAAPLPADRKLGGSWFRQRLIAAGIGFAVGFGAGMGMSFYLPSNGGTWDWQSRFLTGMAVGGLGALLGLVSGNIRL
jgi:hypothetical protein